MGRRCRGVGVQEIGRSIWLLMALVFLFAFPGDFVRAETQPQGAAPQAPENREISWEMPGRVAIYDLQFGSASFEDNKLTFQGSSRVFSATKFASRLTLMVKFSYRGPRADIPLKFVIRMPDSRQYEETITLPDKEGTCAYPFTIHRPEDFVGTGTVYLYYGFSIVDVLDFTIMPGT